MKANSPFSHETQSCWKLSQKFDGTPGKKKFACDVCIVGAGIAGLSTAYFLAKKGRSVIVLDMGPLGAGQTGRTSAHLSWAMDDGLPELIRHHGEEKTRLIVQSHQEAIRQIEHIVHAEKIACDFARVDGYLFESVENPDQSIEEEFRSYQRLGFSGVEKLSSAPGLPFETGPCLRFSNQAQFHPMKYLKGLADVLLKMGVRIYPHTKVDQIEDGSPPHLVLQDGTLAAADAIVVTTDTPINDRVLLHTKQAAYRSYVVAAKIPKGSVPSALYWDTEEPYHYLRVAPCEDSPNEDLLIVGGEDHKTGQDDHPENRFQRLEKWVQDRFPRVTQFVHHWSGQIFEPVDQVPFIGVNPLGQNVYIATGDSGHGLTAGTIAGILISDLIIGHVHPWTAVYDPSRITLRSGLEFMRENLNTALQYFDHFKIPEIEHVKKIQPGEGAVMQKGMRKIAVYKHEDGTVTKMSALCPHLNGVVHWNSVEKSWDCPCHGSRFDAEGQVITGPAVSGLEPIAREDEGVPHHVKPAPKERPQAAREGG